jgi:hypothetical protein
MIRPFFVASPLPLAGESLPSGLTRGSMREARRVGARTTHTGALVGHPHPNPQEREEQRSAFYAAAAAAFFGGKRP